jgi:signal transduction histidine kinase
MPWWWAWALLTPGVFWLASRFRLDRRGWWRRSLGLHFLAAILVSFIHLASTGILFFYTTSRHLGFIPNPGQQIRSFVDAYLAVDVLIYFAVAGGYYALGFYRRYRERELAAALLEARMHEARLQALRMELNPHFLFNALNSVAGLVRRGEDDAAVGVLARLGDLLRHTLDRQPVSRLEEELDLLRQYLEIERIRFGDRLIVEEEIDPDTLDVPVPALILQPLVENAVRHGIAPTPGPGRVVIGASRVNGSLRLSVRDTGSGFPPVLREGIGLSNTRARLAQLYGDRASLSLNGSGGDSGAVVTLILPIAATEN